METLKCTGCKQIHRDCTCTIVRTFWNAPSTLEHIFVDRLRPAKYEGRLSVTQKSDFLHESEICYFDLAHAEHTGANIVKAKVGRGYHCVLKESSLFYFKSNVSPSVVYHASSSSALQRACASHLTKK
jgi:hypothetical protein